MASEEQYIDSYEDIEFSTEVFLPLTSWCIDNTKSGVVIFSCGNVIISENNRQQKDMVIRVMARHFLPVKRIFFTKNQDILDSFFDVMSEFQDDKVEDKNTDKSEMTEAQEDLRSIIKSAFDLNVSDIHIEVRKKIAKIKFRKDGSMFTFREWSASRATRITFVAFNKESDDVKKHFSSSIPHDASMEIVIQGQPIRVRLASIPAYPYPGFDIVMRILTVQNSITELSGLGYTDNQLNLLKRNMKRKSGAIIIAGATGSGKTTTLAALISKIPKDKKIYTIEDPVEKRLANATQIPTNSDNSLCTFAALTRQTMRMDPDCIVIGEVRDEDTASMMSRASITGHLVLTTLHANSAINIVLRLKDLGLDTSTLTDPSFLSVLGYQTLVKKLCSVCKVPDDDSEVIEKFGKNVYKKSTGTRCKQCNGSGIDGRLVIAELIQLGEQEFQHINNNTWFEWHKQLKQSGLTVQAQAKSYISSGVISLHDAESSVGLLDS
ncbi:Flp pilus assembly complex ATPase component TadA [Vibrio sp. S4M6]|uniref:GspE/PulE family protein n=1 Tax=Vibrio sinus TaxID=2946865 RepID=UPI00202A8632|nr:ATPase, T2SS/T4P/T4SS family [Vibrio sinus]MCL9780657.1 Flp pilus assembly complex ATPase component TadA [Vibrio sinus]